MTAFMGLFEPIFGAPVGAGGASTTAAGSTTAAATSTPAPTTTAPATTTAAATTTSGGLASFTEEFSGGLDDWNQTHVVGVRDFSVVSGSAQLAIESWAQAETVAMHKTAMASPDHLAQITETSLVNGYDGWHKLIARAASASGNPADAYVLVRHRTTDYGGPIWSLKRRVGGVETLLTSGSGDGGTVTWRLSVSGTGATVTLTVWSSADGTLATYEDTSEDRITAGDYVGWAAGYDASSSWEYPMAIGEFHAETV